VESPDVSDLGQRQSKADSHAGILAVLATRDGPVKRRSGGKPAVHDFIRRPGKNAENPGQIDNRGAFADFVHV
jgi:hypothetical protein